MINEMINRQTKKFQRHIEAFVCEHCGAKVTGNGYTNHCPVCFTSKHVDVYPGDRAANCGGLMPVIEIVLEHGDWVLLQQCEKCQHVRRNRVQPEDDRDKLAELQARLNEQRLR